MINLRPIESLNLSMNGHRRLKLKICSTFPQHRRKTEAIKLEFQPKTQRFLEFDEDKSDKSHPRNKYLL